MQALDSDRIHVPEYFDLQHDVDSQPSSRRSLYLELCPGCVVVVVVDIVVVVDNPWASARQFPPTSSAIIMEHREGGRKEGGELGKKLGWRFECGGRALGPPREQGEGHVGHLRDRSGFVKKKMEGISSSMQEG